MKEKAIKQEIIAFIKASGNETNQKLAEHIKRGKAIKEIGKAKAAR